MEDYQLHRLHHVMTLEETRDDAMDLNKRIQAQRKELHDQQLRTVDVKNGDLVLLYDNCHLKFLGKLHLWWMGP